MEKNIELIEKVWKDFEPNLYKEFVDDWRLFLLINISDRTSPLTTEDYFTILEVITKINNKDKINAKKVLIEKTRGETFSTSLRAIVLFSKKGVDFYKYLKEYDYSPQTSQYLEHIELLQTLYGENENHRKISKQKKLEMMKRLDEDFSKI